MGAQKLKCEPEKISFYTDAFTTVVGAKALTNCEMFALDGADFHALVEDYPAALEEIKSLSLRYYCPRPFISFWRPRATHHPTSPQQLKKGKKK